MRLRRDQGDGKYFLDVQEILRTGRRTTFGNGETKVMSFVLEGAAADLDITEKSFTIRFDWNSSRNPYFSDLAPGVVSALLDWCDVSVASEPLAARFSAERIPRSGYLRRPRQDAAWNVWFFPGPTVQIMVRRAQPDTAAPLAGVPPVPIREPNRTVALARPHVCPHCGHPALSYRNLVTAWLCNACARTFSVGPEQ